MLYYHHHVLTACLDKPSCPLAVSAQVGSSLYRDPVIMDPEQIAGHCLSLGMLVRIDWMKSV